MLEKACEDYPRKLDVEINGAMPLDYMIPKFLLLSEHPSSKMRAHAIACLSYFVPIGCFTHIDTFIAAFFKHAMDDDPSVRRRVMPGEADVQDEQCRLVHAVLDT